MCASKVVLGEDFYFTPDGLLNSKIVNSAARKICDELVNRYSCFEIGIVMGYGDGCLVEYYSKKSSKLHVIEGSSRLADVARSRCANCANVLVHNSYFEDFVQKEGELADFVLGTHVLEHVDDPIAVIRRSRSWVKQQSTTIFTVPNALSLHRRIGVRLGLLATPYELNYQDLRVGHQRVFDSVKLEEAAKLAGAKIVEKGGYSLKIVSQSQMRDWSNELLDAIFHVSRECTPEVCSNLYMVL